MLTVQKFSVHGSRLDCRQYNPDW